MAIIKGFDLNKRKPKLVHNLVKRGYTKAHVKNSGKGKFKDFSHPVRLHHGRAQPPQLEEGDNNFTNSQENEQ